MLKSDKSAILRSHGNFQTQIIFGKKKSGGVKKKFKNLLR